MQTVQIAQTSRAARSTTAAPPIAAVSSADVDLLVDSLRLEARRLRRKNRLLYTGFATLCIVWLALMIFSWVCGHHWIRGPGPWCMTGLLALMARSSRRHKELARQAAEKADVRFVGPLAEAITPADRELQSTVFPLLERLLPKVDEQTPLTADQRKALAALPGNSAARPALKVAAIDALGRVGDEQSMRTLRRVAGGDSVPESRRLQRDAALRAIPQLEARLKARAVQGQLLRAAGPATQPDALLRAAPVAGQPEPPSTLLRAGSAG